MIGEIVGGAMQAVAGYMGQQQTNEMQHQMMQEQNAFQERMSNTAYQRASTDMQAAGLNPMMMAHGGMNASTPSGASPSPAVKSGLDADAMQKAISTATQAGVAAAQIDNLKAEARNKDAQTLTEVKRPGLLSAQTATEETRAPLHVAQTVTERQRPGAIDASVAESRARERGISAGIPIIQNRALTSANEQKINATARRILDQAAYAGGKGSDTLAPVSDLLNSAGTVRRMFRKDRPGSTINQYGDREINIHN